MATKHQLLASLLEKYKELPAQGTYEWQQARKQTIGGSEMGSIIGVNRYSSIKNWVASKIGINRFSGNIYTRWGHLFEPVTNIIMETMLDTDIYETGSIPCYKRDGIKYSPDGLTVASLIIDNDAEREYLTLMEYKSPLRTIPDGRIPPHYVPQPLTGMCSIPNVDIAIFVNNMYRRCSLSQFSCDLSYDKSFHDKDQSRGVNVSSVSAMGVIYFYQTTAQQLNYNGPDWLQFIDESIDCGESTCNKLDDLLKLAATKQVSILYPKSSTVLIAPVLNDNPFIKTILKNKLDESFDYCSYIKRIKTKYKDRIYKNARQRGYRIIGYLPWKLFITDMIIQKKNDTFLQEHKPQIDKALNILYKINKADDQIRAFNDIFNISTSMSDTDNDVVNANGAITIADLDFL